MSKPTLLEKDIVFTPSPKIENINKESAERVKPETVKGNTIKVPLAILGKWHHSSYGKVEFTQEDFDSIKDGFEKDVLGHIPYITLGHLDEEHHSTDSHRKKGNLLSISQEDDVLYGTFNVKPIVYKWVDEGEYEYVSGEFVRGFLDKEGEEVGTVLLRVALTNSPFVPFGNTKNVALSLNNKKIDLNNTKLQLFSLKTNITMKDNNNKVKTTNKEQLSSTVIEPPKTEEKEEDKMSIEQKDSNESTNINNTEESSTQGTINSSNSGDKSKGGEEVLSEDNSTTKEQSIKVENSEGDNKEEVKQSTDNKEEGEEVSKKSNIDDSKETNSSEQETEVKVNDEESSLNKESIDQENMNVKAEDNQSQNLSQTAPTPQFSNVLMEKDGVNVKALYESVRKCFSQKYQNDLAKRDLEIKGLQEQVISLSQTLEEAKSRTEKQQLSIRDTQSQAVSALEGMLTEYLGGAGVPPALIRKFSTLKDAINTRKDTVKLSLDNNQVEEVTTIQLLADMIIEAVNTNNIPLQQLGVSRHISRLNNDPTGRNGAALETIERNLNKAKSLGRI